MVDLQELFDKQHLLQSKAYNRDPQKLEGEDRVMFIKDMVLALLDEVHEALGEVGWKPWAKSRHVNEEALKGELVDAFHFFMNLCLVSGMDAEELEIRYDIKNEKNLRRQQEGYDGISTKCDKCKRALDDDAVLCTPLLCVYGGTI